MAERPAKGKLRLRCAVYTRKSSEEGLEQEFNSLDAQREAPAMESFFSSLKTEGIGRKVYRSHAMQPGPTCSITSRFYNTMRRHSTIGYVSPVEFETKIGLA